MKYFDAEQASQLKAAFDRVVLDWPGVIEKPMFGCPAYLADGSLFALLVTDGVVLTRLPAQRRADLHEHFPTSPFQAGARTVTKWVKITLPSVADLDALTRFVRESFETARSPVAARNPSR